MSIYEAEPIGKTAEISIYEAEPTKNDTRDSIYEAEQITNSAKNPLYESDEFEHNDLQQMPDNYTYEDPCETRKSLNIGKGRGKKSEGLDNPLYAEVFKTKKGIKQGQVQT